MNKLKYRALSLLILACSTPLSFAELQGAGKALRMSFDARELPYGSDVNFVAGDNADTYRYYIDFAAKNGIEYVFTDKKKLPEGVGEYAQSKRVGIITAKKAPKEGSVARQMAECVADDDVISELPFGIMHYKADKEGTAFITAIPDAWDETVRLTVDGADAVARRSGSDWYLAVTGKASKPVELSLPLAFLPDGEFTAIAFTDGPNAARQPLDVRRTKSFVKGSDTLALHLATDGGYCAKFTPGHILNVKNEPGMRYAADNERVKALPASQRRVVFMGNSITDAWPRVRPDFFTSHGFIGRGFSGQTTYEFLTRFRADVIGLAPEVVVINGGTNDIAENGRNYNEDRTFGHIQSMVELAQAHGIKPILATTLPSAGFSWNREINDAPQKITSLNKRLRAYAAEKGIPFVDYYSAMVEGPSGALKAEYTKDGVHPVAAGYAVMEAAVLPVLESLLAE